MISFCITLKVNDIILIMKKRIGLLTFIALVLGCFCGIILKEKCAQIAFLGTWYISLLKMMITPVIFTSIAYTVYKTSKREDKLILKAIALFMVMFTVTFIISSVIIFLIDPARGFVMEDVAWEGNTAEFSLGGMLLNLLPKSLNDVFINPKVFFVIVFSFLFGKIGSLFDADGLFEGINEVKDFLFRIMEVIMYLTPVATFALMANTVYKYGAVLLGVGLKYILTAYLCALVCLIVVMMLPVRLFAGISLKEYVSKVYKIWIMTVSTCSSAATLPFTVRLCKEEFGISDKTAGVVVPLGCTIHMCGGAVSFALLGIFCLKIYGIDLNIYTYILMIVASLLINMAAPGIPNGGVVVGATYLQIFGVPLGFIGFYSGIYKLLDMCYTTLNVTGDISASILIEKNEKEEKKS